MHSSQQQRGQGGPEMSDGAPGETDRPVQTLTQPVVGSVTGRSGPSRFKTTVIGAIAVLLVGGMAAALFGAHILPLAAPPAGARNLPVTLRGAELAQTKIFRLCRTGTPLDKLTVGAAEAQDIQQLAQLFAGSLAVARQPLSVLWHIPALGGSKFELDSSGGFVTSYGQSVYAVGHDGTCKFQWPLGADTTGDRSYPLAVAASHAYVFDSHNFLVGLDLHSRGLRQLLDIGLPESQWIGVEPDQTIITFAHAQGAPYGDTLLALTPGGRVKWQLQRPYLSDQQVMDEQGRLYCEWGETPNRDANLWVLLSADGAQLAAFPFVGGIPPALAKDGLSYWVAMDPKAELTGNTVQTAVGTSRNAAKSGLPARNYYLIKSDTAGRELWRVGVGSAVSGKLAVLSDQAVAVDAGPQGLACYEPDGRLRWRIAEVCPGAGFGALATWDSGLFASTICPQDSGLANRSALLYVSPEGKAQLFLLPASCSQIWSERITPTPDYILIGNHTALAWPAGIPPPAAK